MENQKQRPGHYQGPDIRAEALENLSFPQDDHPRPQESDQVSPQPHNVQIIPEALHRNAGRPDAFGESEAWVV